MIKDLYTYCAFLIFQKLVFERLYSFLTTHSILYDYQFGFRPQRNTTQAILSLIEFITDALGNRQCLAGIFLDLLKAFDTLDHSMLLSKLNKYGIRGIALSWLNGYLYLRSQYVSINGVNSVHKHVNCGVPRGSILGPLLFVIYINDLPNSSSKFKFVLYADDIALLYRGSNMYNMIQDMTNELHKLISWFNTNKHPLNTDILTFIIFHSHQKQCSLSKHSV